MATACAELDAIAWDLDTLPLTDPVITVELAGRALVALLEHGWTPASPTNASNLRVLIGVARTLHDDRVR